jgi:RecA/RadA recombinase
MANRPFDVSKFRKTITKSIDGISMGFRDPDTWISTGNYALNYLISGSFNKGVPLGKVTVFAGESGAGKSFICSGNLIRNAQQAGIYCILIDTENALDESWLHALGVETTEDKLLKLNLAMIDDVAKMISEFVKEYKTLPEDDRPKVLFILDSLGMLLTPTDVNQFEAGDLKGDMGRKPKALTALVRNCVNMFGDLNIGLIATNHTYASQDMFDPDDKISGGCLTAGHLVWMADGSAKPIEKIQTGDVVVTLDGDIEVSKTFKFDDKEVFEIELDTGEIIKATSEHKFLTQTDDNKLEWKTVSDLNENDHILRVV